MHTFSGSGKKEAAEQGLGGVAGRDQNVAVGNKNDGESGILDGERKKKVKERIGNEWRRKKEI